MPALSGELVAPALPALPEGWPPAPALEPPLPLEPLEPPLVPGPLPLPDEPQATENADRQTTVRAVWRSM
jgi:hypothetical protein